MRRNIDRSLSEQSNVPLRISQSNLELILGHNQQNPPAPLRTSHYPNDCKT